MALVFAACAGSSFWGAFIGAGRTGFAPWSARCSNCGAWAHAVLELSSAKKKIPRLRILQPRLLSCRKISLSHRLLSCKVDERRRRFKRSVARQICEVVRYKDDGFVVSCRCKNRRRRFDRALTGPSLRPGSGSGPTIPSVRSQSSRSITGSRSAPGRPSGASSPWSARCRRDGLLW